MTWKAIFFVFLSLFFGFTCLLAAKIELENNRAEEFINCIEDQKKEAIGHLKEYQSEPISRSDRSIAISYSAIVCQELKRHKLLYSSNSQARHNIKDDDFAGTFIVLRLMGIW